jgi:streptogramin lyase
MMRRKAAAWFFAGVLTSVHAAGATGAVRVGRLLPLPNAEAVTAGAGSVWATGPRLLLRIDPKRDVVIARIDLPGIASAAAVDGRYVWVLTNPIHTSPNKAAPGLLWSVDGATTRVVGKPIPIFPMAQGHIAVAQGSLWITNDNHGRFGRLYRIDPTTRKVVSVVRVPNDPASVVFGSGSLWVGESDTGTVVRVNPKTNAIDGKPINVGGALLTLAAAGDRVWAANSYSGRLVTINARTATVVASRPLAGVSGIAASRGTVWTTFFRKGELAAFDAASGRQTLAPLRIRGGAEWVDAVAGYLWVTSAAGITRVAHG